MKTNNRIKELVEQLWIEEHHDEDDRSPQRFSILFSNFVFTEMMKDVCWILIPVWLQDDSPEYSLKFLKIVHMVELEKKIVDVLGGWCP